MPREKTLSEFVRAQPNTMTTGEVVKAAHAAGLSKANSSNVSSIRWQMKKKQAGPSALKMRGTRAPRALSAHSSALQIELHRLVVRLGWERAQMTVDQVKSAEHAVM